MYSNIVGVWFPNNVIKYGQKKNKKKGKLWLWFWASKM